MMKAMMEAGGFGAPPLVVPYEYPNFRVVAFRFDPCGGEKIPTDLDIKGCGHFEQLSLSAALLAPFL